MEIPRPPLERPRALVLDADQTVVFPDFSNNAPGRIVAAVRKLDAVGVPVTFCTGRLPHAAIGLFEGMGITIPLSADYGNTLVSPEGNVLWHASMDPDVAGQISKRLTEHTGIIPRYEYTSYTSPEEIETSPLQNIIGIKMKSEFGMEKDLADIAKEFYLPFFSRDIRGSTEFAAWPTRLDKGTGLVMLAEIMGVPPEDIITAGDARPDIPMFEVSGWGVAVRNAREEVKASADKIVPGVTNHGVAQLIEKYIVRRLK